MQKKPVNNGNYQDISSDEDDNSVHHTPDKAIKTNLREQLSSDDFLVMPAQNLKRIQSASNQQGAKPEEFGFSFPEQPQKGY